MKLGRNIVGDIQGEGRRDSLRDKVVPKYQSIWTYVEQDPVKMHSLIWKPVR